MSNGRNSDKSSNPISSFNIPHRKGHHQKFPGRPSKCDNIPNSKACKKCRGNNGMLCINCRAI